MRNSNQNFNDNQFPANHSSSLLNSSRISEIANPFHSYLMAAQIIPKEPSSQDLQDIPFDEQSYRIALSPRVDSPNVIVPSIQKEFTPTSAQYQGKDFEQFSNENNKKLHQFIIIKTLVSSFLSNLKRKAYIYTTSSSPEFKLITQERYLKDFKIAEKTSENTEMSILQKIPLIPPQSTFVLFWDFFLFLQILLITFWGPFLISFCPNRSTFIVVFENLLRYVGIIDMLMKTNKCVILQGTILQKRKLILLYYVKTDLTFDFFSILILFINDSNYSNTVEVIQIMLAGIQVFISVTRLRHFLEKLQDIFDEYQNFFELTKVLLIIFIFAHVTACIWQKIAQLTEDEGLPTWMTRIHLSDSNIWIRYNYSFYWATMTMVTVGYGDITPQNPYEMLFCNMTMIVSSAIFGYSLNTIGMILQNISNKLQKYKKYSIQMNQYMNRNQVNSQLQSKVRNYLKFYFEQDNIKNDDEISTLITKLTPTLRQELVYDIQSRPLQYCSFFSKHVSPDVQKQIAFALQSHHYNPSEIIYTQNSIDDELSLYIVVKGEIRLMDLTSGQVLKTFHKGQCFGEYEFFTGKQRQCTAKSIDFSQVYKISREEILSILNNNQNDKEKFHNIKDQLLQYLPCKDSGLNCYCCHQSSHFITDCPLIRFIPDLERIIKQEGFLFQERHLIKRSKRRSRNSLFQMKENSKQCFKYLSDSKMLDNEEISEISENDEEELSETHQAFERSEDYDKVEVKDKGEEKDKDSSIEKEKVYIKNSKNKFKTMNSEKPHSSHQTSHYQDGNERSFNRMTSVKQLDKNSIQIQIAKVQPENDKSNNELQTLRTKGIQSAIHSAENSDIYSNVSVINMENMNICEIKIEEIVSKFQCCDIDKMETFKYYFIDSNYHQVILDYQKSQRYVKILKRQDIGKYSFYFKAKKFKAQYKLKRLRQVARSYQAIQIQPRRSKQAKTSLFYQPPSMMQIKQ